jgi:hypothetical protein
MALFSTFAMFANFAVKNTSIRAHSFIRGYPCTLNRSIAAASRDGVALLSVAVP